MTEQRKRNKMCREAIDAWLTFRKEPYLTNVPDGGYVYIQMRATFTIAMLKLAHDLGFKEEDIV